MKNYRVDISGNNQMSDAYLPPKNFHKRDPDLTTDEEGFNRFKNLLNTSSGYTRIMVSHRNIPAMDEDPPTRDEEFRQQDVEIVSIQSSSSRKMAIKALRKYNGDLVCAIMYLSENTVP